MMNHKKHLTAFLLSLAALAFVGCNGEKGLRYMSYNIKNGCGMDNKTDYTRIASVIKQENPDVVAIQELDSVTKRSGQKYVLGELARLTGLHATYAAAIDYSGGKYGIGLLSKEKPEHVYRYALPGREEARALLVADFKDYVCCCTHLSLTEADRMLSYPIIKQAVSHFKKPVFIAGDWNATPGSGFIKQVNDDFIILTDTSRFTFPADTPQCTLDYIALSKNVPVSIMMEEANVIDAPVESDHRPVTVAIKWK